MCYCLLLPSIPQLQIFVILKLVIMELFVIDEEAEGLVQLLATLNKKIDTAKLVTL